MDSSIECQPNRASATSDECFVAKDEGKSTEIASNRVQCQRMYGEHGSDVLSVEEFSSLDDFQEIFKQIDFGGESAEINVDGLESKEETNPCERQAEAVNASYPYGEKVVDIKNLPSFQNSRPVTWKEGEACNTLLNQSGEGSMSNAMVQFTLGANGSLLSTQATFESSELQNQSMLTGMDQPFSVHRPVRDAFDMDNLSSPRSLSLDTSLVEKLLPSSPVSPLPKFDSFFPEFTQANRAESRSQNIDKSLNVNWLDQESCENEMNQIRSTSKLNQTTNKLCQFSYSNQENLLDNCFQPYGTEQENKIEKHNQYSLIHNGHPTNTSLNVQQFGTHNHNPDFLVYRGKEQGIAAACYDSNHIEQQNLCNDSSLAVTTGSPTNLIPLFDFDFQNQACSVGSAGSGLQQTINKLGTSTVAPLQRVDFRNLIDAKDVSLNLRRSFSGISSNRQRSRIPSGMSEEETDGLHGWKREWHISMDISLHDLELKNKKQKVEADGEESASILKRSDSEDARLRPGLSAANAILDILYPQIFFILNRVTKAEQGSERQLDANILLDLELQALADQQKLPAHIYSALSSTASTNSFPFSTDLLLIRHIHHKLLTQLQSMESRACKTIKDTIMKFHFLHSNSSEVCRLKTSSLKVLYAQCRSMLLKSFRDTVLLQHSKETDSNSVQSTLKTERPGLCPLTRQDQEANFCSTSAIPSSHECEPLDASICDVMTSMNPASLCCTGEEIFDSSTDASRRKRLSKEACTFMDKYLLTNRGRIKRSEKEAIARLLKLNFKQVEIYLSNARARKFKHDVEHSPGPQRGSGMDPSMGFL